MTLKASSLNSCRSEDLQYPSCQYNGKPPLCYGSAKCSTRWSKRLHGVEQKPPGGGASANPVAVPSLSYIVYILPT